MDGFHYDWDDAEELDGNTIHIESAGVSQDEFQQVIEDPYALEFVSRSSGDRVSVGALTKVERSL